MDWKKRDKAMARGLRVELLMPLVSMGMWFLVTEDGRMSFAVREDELKARDPSPSPAPPEANP